MILMALDHTRDFFGVPGDPTNLATSSAPLFLTRWVTHFCAPTFFLLTGVGSRLALGRRSVAELSRFLLARGVLLIVLETVVLRCLVYQFNIDFRVTMLLVLWALGWSMIVLAVLVHAGWRIAAGVGLVLIVGHNALDGFRFDEPLGHPLWNVLHQPGVVLNANGHIVFAAYPLLPWIGVTAVGYALGGLYSLEPTRRRSWLWRGGLSAIAAFIVLRWLNVYGDPSRWTSQTDPALTFLSFLNTTKYPPSLLFLLMTLGPTGLLLFAVDRGTPAMTKAVVAIGRVPLFYFVAHFFLLHVLAVIVCLVRYGNAHWMFESLDLAHYPFTPPPGWGYSLPIVYAIWLSVVFTLYPACKRYGRLKATQRHRWLGYL